MLFAWPDKWDTQDSPFAIALCMGIGLLLLSWVVAYLHNLTSGHRGTAAVPLYRYFVASLAHSDYQLKSGASLPPTPISM